MFFKIEFGKVIPTQVGNELLVKENLSFDDFEIKAKGNLFNGRWPANIIHDGSDEVVAMFPHTKSGGGDKRNKTGNTYEGWGFKSQAVGFIKSTGGDEGSAARFFYCAKASKLDRNEGLDEFNDIVQKRTQSGGDDTRGRPVPVNKNNHPTVKNTELMKYLCRLITPPGGTILDPFCGSGSTLKAAILEGFDCIGIDLDKHYIEISKARCDYALALVRNACDIVDKDKLSSLSDLQHIQNQNHEKE